MDTSVRTDRGQAKTDRCCIDRIIVSPGKPSKTVSIRNMWNQPGRFIGVLGFLSSEPEGFENSPLTTNERDLHEVVKTEQKDKMKPSRSISIKPILSAAT